jgi:hypothetical protein
VVRGKAPAGGGADDADCTELELLQAASVNPAPSRAAMAVRVINVVGFMARALSLILWLRVVRRGSP